MVLFLGIWIWNRPEGIYLARYLAIHLSSYLAQSISHTLHKTSSDECIPL